MSLNVAALTLGTLAVLGRAAQPEALTPVPAPMRDLQWAQLNFLHTTDTHGWHAGHLQESQYSADWGDYISFAEHMRKRADDEGRDLLLVDTGDRVEGNGLYDASSPAGKYYYDIYKEQPIDIICIGNHELYQAPTADREYQRTVPNYKENYVASNLDYIDPESGKRIPMAQRYRKFQTKNQKLNIVAFGFLFDFKGNANNTVVTPVESVIEQQWFQDAIREETDLFVVVGHVGVRMQEFKAIFTAIRKQNWFTPIAFFGGHVHVRDATAYDSRSFALASGRYMETIGWMSIDGITKKSTEVSTEATPSFTRRYIDNNLLGLYHHSGLNESTFATERGKNVTKMIRKARKELDLDYVYGCAPQDYWMTRTPYPSNDSIYTWLEKEVLPGVAVNSKREGVPRVAIMNTGAMRFDIFKGAFTRDTTYIISPFLSRFVYIQDVPYDIAKKVLPLINNGGQIMDSPGLDSRFMTIPEQWSIHEPIIYDHHESHASYLDEAFDSQKPMGSSGEGDEKPNLVSGYTTKDDIGNDGDDAEHSPINFYTVPNCIQAEVGFPAEDEDKPKDVDLVFFDFVQPWVLLALKFSGGDYSAKNVRPYNNATFTELMEEWIKENWTKHC